MLYSSSINHKVVAYTLKILKGISSTAPRVILKPLLQAAFTQVFKQQLLNQELGFFAEKCLQVKVSDIAFEFYLRLQQNKFAVEFKPQNANVVFTCDSENLFLLAANKADPDTLFFQRKLSIQGDTELGLHIKNLLASLDLINQLNSPLRTGLDSIARTLQERKQI